MTEKPKIISPNPSSMPKTLLVEPRWIIWRLEWKKQDERWNKTPYDPNTRKLASSTNPKNWTSFEAAWRAFDTERKRFSGVGFVLGDGWIGVDLDGCRDPDTEVIAPWATTTLGETPGYAEVSVSGTGAHVICRGSLPAGRRERDEGDHLGIALYDKGRYFTMTGMTLPESAEITDITPALTALHQRLFPKIADRPKASESQPLEDDLLTKALAADPKLAQLWNGVITAYPSQSEADLALCMKLTFWFGRDPDRVSSLFRQSGLMREKWERKDYRERTLKSALENQTTTRSEYQKRYSANSGGSHRFNGAPRDEDAPPPRRDQPPDILPTGLTVRELLNLKLDPPEMLIEDVLPRRGAVLLTASQKTGKTILAAQMAITVATNTPLFQNYPLCAHGPVLILEQDDPAGDASFQDIYRRSKVPDEAPLRFYGKIGLRLSQAFYEWLEREIVAHKAVMVVLDSYTALRPHRNGGGDIVQMEQQEFTALDTLGKKLNALILVIHHESTSTKANAQLDWDSRGAGTYGITMATEAQLSLVRFRDLSIDAPERLLRIKGRHQKTVEMVLAFQEDVCGYRHIFDGSAASYYPLLHDIYRFKGSQSFSPGDLKVEIGTSDSTVYRYLAALRFTGKLIREERGQYRLSHQAAQELGGNNERF